MIVVEHEISRDVDISAATCFWNSWDHEHLFYVHDNYTRASILHEDSHCAVLTTVIKVPVFHFLRSRGLHIMVHTDEYTTKVFNIGLFGIPSVTTMVVEELGPHRSRLRNHYTFILTGWKQLLAPLFRRMIEKWNDFNWREDEPLKSRRDMVLKLGFKDFVGLPEKIEDRKFEGPTPKVSLPIARFKESILNELR
jgi:hypothetical protein